MEMKGPMGHALATQKNEKLGKSDTQQSDSGEEKKEDLVIKKEPQPAEFIDLSKPKQPKEATKVLKDSTQSTPRKKTTKDTYAPDGTSKSKKSRDGLRSPRERPASERLPKVDMKGIVEESAPLEKSNSKTLANKKNPSMSSPRKGNEELRGSVKISKVEEKLNAEPKGNEEKKKHTKSADPESKPEKNNNSGEHHHHHHHHNEDKEEVKSKSHKHHAEETKKETTDEAEANRYMQRKKAKKNPSIPEDKSTSSGLSNDLKQSDQNASNNNS